LPDFSAAVCPNPTQIDNPFFELEPGTTFMLRAQSPDGVEIIPAEVLDQTRVVDGVTTRVVRDRAFEDGLLLLRGRGRGHGARRGTGRRRRPGERPRALNPLVEGHATTALTITTLVVFVGAS